MSDCIYCGSASAREIARRKRGSMLEMNMVCDDCGHKFVELHTVGERVEGGSRCLLDCPARGRCEDEQHAERCAVYRAISIKKLRAIRD